MTWHGRIWNRLYYTLLVLVEKKILCDTERYKCYTVLISKQRQNEKVRYGTDERAARTCVSAEKDVN